MYLIVLDWTPNFNLNSSEIFEDQCLRSSENNDELAHSDCAANESAGGPEPPGIRIAI
jgi:hypothetical protein